MNINKLKGKTITAIKKQRGYFFATLNNGMVLEVSSRYKNYSLQDFAYDKILNNKIKKLEVLDKVENSIGTYDMNLILYTKLGKTIIVFVYNNVVEDRGYNCGKSNMLKIWLNTKSRGLFIPLKHLKNNNKKEDNI